MTYITATDIKSFLAIDSNTDNALLESLAGRAQRYIELWTGRVFEASADSVKTFDAVADVYPDETGALTLLLWGKRYDLCAITSVVNGDGTTVASSQYVTEPRHETPYQGLRLKRNATASWTYTDAPENAIAITGKWTYSASAPADVIQATLDLAVYIYRRRGVEGAGLDRVVISPSGVTMAPPGLPETVKGAVKAYRRWWRGF